MLRCENERSGLSGIEGIRNLIDLGPYAIDELLRECFLWVGGDADLTWWVLYWDELPHEMLEKRTELLMYLARYGRQDIFSWEHRTPDELVRAGAALSAVLKAEKEASRSPGFDENDT